MQSSSSSSASTDLSPYIPGLKKLVLQDTRRRTGTLTLHRAEHTFFVDTALFTFSSSNKDTYTFEYVMGTLPSGATFSDYTHSTDYDYTYRHITIAESCPDKSSFSFYVKAYATAHPEAPIYSNTLTCNVYNPAGNYLDANLPGLLGVDVLANGISTEYEVTPGTYPLTIATNPSTYLADTGSTITISDDTSYTVVYSIKDNVLTVVTGNVSTLRWPVKTIIHCGLTGKDVTISRPFFLFPSAKEFSAMPFTWNSRPFRIKDSNGRRGGNFGPGNYTLKAAYFEDCTVPDDSWCIKVNYDESCPSDVVVTPTTPTGDIALTVPNTLAQGETFKFKIVLYEVANPSNQETSAEFYGEYRS